MGDGYQVLHRHSIGILSGKFIFREKEHGLDAENSDSAEAESARQARAILAAARDSRAHARPSRRGRARAFDMGQSNLTA